MEQSQRTAFVFNPRPGEMTVKMLFLLDLKRCLDKHLANADLDAAVIAREMGISKSTLNRRLKAILNQSINVFIKQYRLQRAIEYLSAGYKVREVSNRVGFQTPSYFTQCFKAYYQQTPSAFNKA